MTTTATRSRNERTTKKDTVVNLRMPASVRDLIDDAAELAGKTRTAFIIESSRRDAMDVLLDQQLFALNAKQYDAFLKALDEPPVPNDKLKRLMARTSPWEK